MYGVVGTTVRLREDRMTGNPPADESDDSAGDDGERAVQVFEWYFDPAKDVEDNDLRDALDGDVAGTVVEVHALDNEVFVFVARPTGPNCETIRDCYVVHRIVGFEGEHELDWTYLGRAQ